MLPSDVLGVSVWEPKTSEFVFKPGPLFTNIILADEINRTTPKTQSSLLEAMNEAQVSLDHSTYPLPRPFMVLATQNPREYEGTFPLPESQLDRFLLRVRIGYPEAADEKDVLRGTVAPTPARLGPVLTVEEVLELQDAAEQVRAEESVLDYLVALVGATRRSPLLSLGVSPRGSLALLRAARARALADGRDYLVPDDIKELAVAALAHRVMLDVLREQFILAGRAKGLSERVVVYKHALKNAIIPTLTVVGITFAILIGGAVVIETVFNIPGLGRLIISAVLRRDYPVIQGVVLLIAVTYTVVNLVVDLAYLALDPRIRYR